MRDQSDSVAEQRTDPGYELGILHLGLSRQRRYSHATITLVDPVESADSIDVDQVRRTGKPEIQQRNERLAAGQHLRVFERDKQRARLVDGARCVVLETRRLHCSSIATARHNAASPPWNRQGKQPNRILRSSTSSRRPPRFSMWITSCGNSSVCMIW